MDIEEKNAREEVQELLERCTRCGLCKELCPPFLVLREEDKSPRAHAILLSNKQFSDIIWQCTLCRACEEKCPFKLEMCKAIKKARQVTNLRGRENSEMKKIIKKMNLGDNPYS
jgi:glycolate oxidase iron-sulfur subunit